MTRRALTDPRKSPRQARSLATVDALVEAATRILAQDGYERANVNRIAELAGVSVGSLYQYYPTKDALVAAVAKRHFDAMTKEFEKGLAEIAMLAPPDAVRAIVKRALVVFAINPKLRKVILEEVPRGESFKDTYEFDERLATVIEGYFIFHAGKVRPKNHALAARLLITAVEAIARRYSLEEPEKLASEEFAAEVSELVIRYFWQG